MENVSPRLPVQYPPIQIQPETFEAWIINFTFRMWMQSIATNISSSKEQHVLSSNSSVCVGENLYKLFISSSFRSPTQGCFLLYHLQRRRRSLYAARMFGNDMQAGRQSTYKWTTRQVQISSEVHHPPGSRHSVHNVHNIMTIRWVCRVTRMFAHGLQSKHKCRAVQCSFSTVQVIQVTGA